MKQVLPQKIFMVDLNFKVCKIQDINISEPIHVAVKKNLHYS